MQAQPAPLDDARRRRALRLVVWEGVLSMGAGDVLLLGWVLTYFCQEMGARDVSLAVVLAVPSFMGLLRLAAPLVISRTGNRKWVCILSHSLAIAVALVMPALALGLVRPPAELRLSVLIAVLCAMFLFRYIGSVAWLSWMGDLVPSTHWGRYFGLRAAWWNAVAMLTGLAVGAGLDAWTQAFPDRKLAGYGCVLLIGITAKLASLVPLLFVPNLPLGRSPATPPGWREILVPLRDPEFRRLARFGCWLALGQGFPQAAFGQAAFRFLQLPQLAMQSNRIVARVFNVLGNRTAGRLSDRFGNRPVLSLALLFASTGPFFWLPASPGVWTAWFSVFIAHAVWGAGWAGVVLSEQNLLLKLSPRGNNAAYLAAYEALTGLTSAASILLGGLLLRRLTTIDFHLSLGPAALNAYQIFFLLSFVGQASALFWLRSVTEPRSRTVSHLFRALARVPGLRPRRLASRAVAGVAILLRGSTARAAADPLTSGPPSTPST